MRQEFFIYTPFENGPFNTKFSRMLEKAERDGRVQEVFEDELLSLYFVRQRQYKKKSVMELNQVFKILIKEIFEY